MTTVKTTTGGIRAPRRGSALAARQRSGGPSLWFLLPAALLFGGFAILPLLGAVVLSFTQWSGLGTPQWLGADNWLWFVTDPVTYTTLGITFAVMFGSLLVQGPISMLLGVWIARSGGFRSFAGLIFFVPLLLSSAAVALAYKNLLDPNFGLSTQDGFGWLAHNWLGDKNTVLIMVILVIAWHFVPLHTLLYQGGVRQIPASLYEAASIDGAGKIMQFFTITVPQLKYTIVTSSTLIVVGSLTYFDLIFVMTAGGPGYATRVLPLHMYLTGFRSAEMGKASVIATVLVLIGLVLSLALTRWSGFSKMKSQQEGM
ncbi:carbohydrate ABC transporter permease [Salinibacterium sp. SWN1162]|uniref:carbohydrate ABC transporter permease n=1 Tax=Salinibacterium sp. SWN1162 TaxID=2792053 RepID=UPI0018CF0B61|nr:sugar ABC transporter permease [Salinibacterium sp. SWN1162]MBH0008185.1 sugar ABC transporter permease [Salinibacterium sp. SWN1162]